MEKLVNSGAPQRKMFGILCALSVLLMSVPLANGTPPKDEPKIHLSEPLETVPDDDAKFEKVWVEHDVRVDGKKGMRIHAKFIVKNSLNTSCTLIAQFYRRDGSYLKSDGQPAYTTSEGHVYTYVNVKPRFTNTRYEDKSLFIPYEAFNIKGGGVYFLKFVLFVDRSAQGFIQTIGHSADFNFKYTKAPQG